MQVTMKDNGAQGFALSVLFHAAVIASAWVSMPFLSRDLPIDTPIIVELVPIDEITAAPPKPVPQPEVKEEPKPEEKPEPPKVADEPKPAENVMPPPPKEEPIPPPPKEVAEVKPPPKVAPPPPKPKPKPKKDDWADLQSLVKNLEKKEAAEEKKEQKVAAATQPNDAKILNAAVADRATMTELDAIRRHIEGCWRIDPGKEGIEDLSAEIQVHIRPDGSVQTADILDMARYFSDAQFRTFATSARLAVLSCGNIPISPQRYETFKELTLNFSPQGRIN